ncbi:hypothetical protein [Pyxidicoccus caerfyrddinensis]|uniref:hypothetical protein n=1 Tax=Pyxidicoccus caerfyrddinensis TaxID=2709663 RepID=UPI0013DBC1A7|nr:hypothetical protein [Pyxidicoccus caerfyrddinensis]
MGIQKSTSAATTNRVMTTRQPEAVPVRPGTAPLPQSSRTPRSLLEQDSFSFKPQPRGPDLTGAERTVPLMESQPSSMAMRAVGLGPVKTPPTGGGVTIPFRIRLGHLTPQQRQELTPRELLIQLGMQYHKVDRAQAEAMVNTGQLSWKGKEPTLTAADRNAPFYEVPLTDYTLQAMSDADAKESDSLFNGLPPGDQKRLKGEAMKEFESRTRGTYRPTSPQDRDYLKSIQRDLLLKELFQQLPEHVREVLFKEGAPAPKDAAAALRAGQALAKLSPLELADYLSKVTGTTSDWGALEKSVDTYLAQRTERLQELEKLQGLSKRLDGLGALYTELKALRNLEKYPVSPEDGPSLTRHLNEIDAKKANLTAELQRQGISGIPEFETLLRDYRSAFEKETVSVAKDLMGRTDHALYELQNKYRDPAVTQDLYQRLSKAREYEAKAVEAERSSANLQLGADSPSMQPPQVRQQQQELRNEAASWRAKARQEAAQLTRDHPILRDEKLKLRDLVQAPPERIQSLIQEHLAERRQNIQDTRANIASNPDLIYGFDVLLSTSKQVQNIQPGSVQDMLIQDRDAELKFDKFLVDAGLSALGLAAGMLSGGTALLPLIAAASIGGVQVMREVQDYKVQDAAYGAGMQEVDPSLAGVALAVVGAGFDLLAAGPIFDAVKAFRASRVRDLAKLEKDLKAVPNISDDLVKRLMDVERKGMSMPQATRDVDTAVRDIRAAGAQFRDDAISAGELKAKLLKAVDDVGGDPRIRARLELLHPQLVSKVFQDPWPLMNALAAKDPQRTKQLLEVLDRLPVGSKYETIDLPGAMRKALSQPPTGNGEQVVDPAMIRKLFRDKFGTEEVVVQRGIRIPKGAEVQGSVANKDGQMVVVNNMSAAKQYARQAPGLERGPLDTDEMVVVEFRIRPEHIRKDMYGSMEHLILKPDVDIMKLPGFRVVSREPYFPEK